MSQLWNLAQNREVNPLDKIQGFTVNAFSGSPYKDKLEEIANSSPNVECKKIGNQWRILFPIALLDRVVLVQWSSPTTGKMYFKQYSYVYFEVREDILMF